MFSLLLQRKQLRGSFLLALCQCTKQALQLLLCLPGLLGVLLLETAEFLLRLFGLLLQRYQVRGYVRNRADGRVEAWAQGPEKSVEAFKHDIAAGPRYSRVDEIEEIVLEPSTEYSSFRIER